MIQTCDNEKNCFDSSDEICNNVNAINPKFQKSTLHFYSNNFFIFFYHIKSYNGKHFFGLKGCRLEKQFFCGSFCISNELRNDGKIDCSIKNEEKGIIEHKNCGMEVSSMGYMITNLFSAISCSEKHCARGQYLCYHDRYCISIELICDGISHCYFGDDEYDCSWFFLNIILSIFFRH